LKNYFAGSKVKNMERRHFILLLFVLLARITFAAPFDISSIRSGQFKADDYIRAAVSLQAMGRDAACQALLASAKTNAGLDNRFFVLCRMLFTQRGTNEFQPPFRGGCVFFIGEEADWPLAPIALVDEIPFFLTGGCGGDGGRGPESIVTYLNYCITNCDWSSYKFHEVTAKQKSDALTKLLSSNKVRQPLNDFQKQFFSGQIE
jgi:hypothetical protein